MVTDSWASGDAYEPFMGRWSRSVAARFIAWLAPAGGRDWLDLGCGTGALTETILSAADPRSVRAIDASPLFVDHARARTVDERVEFGIGDASSIDAENASFDYVVSGLALNFFPDTEKAVAEMRRVGRPGADVAAYVWDYAEGMQMLRHFWDAVSEVDPTNGVLDEGARFPICRPDALTKSWQQAGFAHVRFEAIEVPTLFASFDDYWDPFLGAQGPAPTYLMGLPDDKRTQVRETLRGRLPLGDEGRIRLSARAWAICGTNE